MTFTKVKTRPRGRVQAKMSAAHYALIASILRGVEDESIRLQMIKHFGKAFDNRSAVFDWFQWNRMTGADRP